MTRFIAYDDATDTREQLGTPGQEIWRTWFLKPPAPMRLPQAFLVEYAPGRVLRTHFHDVDEFQIVMAGGGSFGRRAVAPYMVHFARAFTPYGPIEAGPEGLSFLTLRARRDSAGPQKLPEMREALERVPNRRPFQVSQHVPPGAAGDTVTITPLESLCGDGRAGWNVTVAPDATVTLPVAAGSSGQYAALVKGSIVAGSLTTNAPGIVFTAPFEAPLVVTAGANGAQILVLGFPAEATAAAAPVGAVVPVSSP